MMPIINGASLLEAVQLLHGTTPITFTDLITPGRYPPNTTELGEPFVGNADSAGPFGGTLGSAGNDSSSDSQLRVSDFSVIGHADDAFWIAFGKAGQ
jgi:hypothetical protein